MVRFCPLRRGQIKHHPSCAAGLAVVVLQSGDQTSHPGHTVSFVCNMGQGVSMGSYTMLWYRQTHRGAPLDFLSKEYDQTTGHFQSSIDTSRNNFSLQITEVLLNDSSTYYCAASHSDAQGPDVHTNIKSTRGPQMAHRQEGAVGSVVFYEIGGTRKNK